MDSGTLSLWLVGALWAVFALWIWVSQKFMSNAHEYHHALKERQDLQGDMLMNLESKMDAVRVVNDEDRRVLLKACAVGPVERRVDELEKTQRILLGADKSNVAYLNRLDERVAGMEAMLVSTVGQETEDFCRKMDELMDRMEKPEPKQAERLTLSEEYVGRFEKKRKK